MFFLDNGNSNQLYLDPLKGSSYRPVKRPTRIPSIRSIDPGPGQFSCQQDLYPGNHAGGKGLCFTPAKTVQVRTLFKIVGGKSAEQNNHPQDFFGSALAAHQAWFSPS
jgi:hypothetical protein